jgi:isopentenyl-diphosphate Delta-isomerase
MKVQIVNNQDELIATKERTEIDFDTDIYRVSALWLTNALGQTLLARRSMQKHNDPGRWGPAVSGTIDEGETYDINIHKEAFEEIGLEGVEFEKGPKMHITHPRNYFCQWYFASLDRDVSSFTMQEDEVDALEWVDIESMKQELQTNPDKYVPAMSQIVRELAL